MQAIRSQGVKYSFTFRVCLVFILSFAFHSRLAMAQSSASDPQKRWPVGALTTELAGLPLEVWYPAAEGSASGKSPLRYDLRRFLPTAEAQKIPDSAEPFQSCACFADLPIAPELSHLPLVIMVHGTAGFRTASLTQATFLAAQGFLVIAADHPAINLKDILTSLFGLFRADQKGDVERILSALQSNEAAIHPYLQLADTTHIGLIGHSAGGGAVSALGRLPGVKALVVMAAGSRIDAAPGVFSLVMGAVDDQVSNYEAQRKAFQNVAAPKAFIGLNRAGHLAFTDICTLMPASGGILNAAITYGLAVPPLVAKLGRDGCKEGQLEPERSAAIINASIAAVLNDTLRGIPAAEALGGLQASFADIKDFEFSP